MGPKMGRRNVKKIEVPTEFELGDTAAHILKRRENREGGGTETTERGEGGNH